MQIHFFSKGAINQISGGYLYNRYLIEQLEEKGENVIYYPIERKIAIEKFLKNATEDDIIIVDSLLIIDNLSFLLDCKNQFLVLGLIHLPQIFDPKNQKAEILSDIFQIERQVFEAIPIIVTSHFCKEKVTDAFGLIPERIFVLEPGVVNFIEKENFKKHPYKLINIAAFDELKGQDKIVNALAQLKSNDWRMHFYGSTENDPNYFQKVMQLIESNDLQDRIVLEGVVNHDQINETMQAADLLIQMSSFETYSMVIAEALATRLPFVSTRVGASSYFDQFLGGVYLPDFNEWSLVTALESLFDNEAAYQQLWKKRKINEIRSWSKVADEFLEIINLQKVMFL